MKVTLIFSDHKVRITNERGDYVYIEGVGAVMTPHVVEIVQKETGNKVIGLQFTTIMDGQDTESQHFSPPFSPLRK